MKKLQFHVLSLVFVPLILSIGFAGKYEDVNEKWSGTVTFIETDKGPDIIFSEWKMAGTFNNGLGTVVHTSKFHFKDGVGEIKRECSTTSESRVEISVDQSKQVYTIMVLGVKDCIGSGIEDGIKKEYSVPGGDTAILIPDQRLGVNKNILSGTITRKTGPLAEGVIQTHNYKWNLVKSP